MSADGQGTKCRRNIAERCTSVTDDRQTEDGRAIAYSECEREFTFAKTTASTVAQVDLTANSQLK